MTMKEMFKKVDVYNEIADVLLSKRARVFFSWSCGLSAESFTTYKDFQNHIKAEYIEPVAEMILKSDKWSLDGKVVSFDWCDSFGECQTSIFYAEISDI